MHFCIGMPIKRFVLFSMQKVLVSATHVKTVVPVMVIVMTIIVNVLKDSEDSGVNQVNLNYNIL